MPKIILFQMACPVRCFSCNKVISGKYEEFIKELEKVNVITDKFNTRENIALNNIGITRICCRLRVLTIIDTVFDKLYISINKVSNK
jgi:DNA-directed RNA polymerase subunit N (RpoN/RPB10)